ncbi:MAG TPA: hypothetical protein VFR47_09380 [Anaerolineales bacterium]|nr:hypothetical protein [Anaerolineales bacterium]
MASSTSPPNGWRLRSAPRAFFPSGVLVGFDTPGVYPECYAIEGVVNHQVGRDHAALTELGTIPALFAGTGLSVVYFHARFVGQTVFEKTA